MKKITISFLIILILIIISYKIFPEIYDFNYKFPLGFSYKQIPVKHIGFCYGDICPGNGGSAWVYDKNFTPEECLNIGGRPLIGTGWSTNYVGCEAITKPLTKEKIDMTLYWIDKLNKQPK